VAVALPRGGLLVSILVVPLAIPVLIFGVSASYAAVTDPDPFLPPFMILSAIALFSRWGLGPVAAARRSGVPVIRLICALKPGAARH
jgi:heme exporter protein B